MDLPWVSDPIRALDLLWPALALTFDAVEEATTTVRRYHEERHQKLDFVFSPQLVRHEVKDRLKREGLKVDDDDSSSADAIDLHDLANNGLSLDFRRRHLRILKCLDGGGVPAPGPSRRRQAFWNQPAASPLFDTLQPQAVELANYLVLWMVDWHYQLQGLRLVLPRAGAITADTVEAYWDIPIPHPVERMRRRVAPSEETEPDLHFQFLPAPGLDDDQAAAEEA